MGQAITWKPTWKWIPVGILLFVALMIMLGDSLPADSEPRALPSPHRPAAGSVPTPTVQARAASELAKPGPSGAEPRAVITAAAQPAKEAGDATGAPAPSAEPAPEVEGARAEPERPLGWLQIPEGVLSEMEERLAALKDIHARATQLPVLATREGLGRAAATMRAVQSECRNAESDYRLRFGSAFASLGLDRTSPESRAHADIGIAFAEICGVCPTLLPNAPAACKSARTRLQQAQTSLATWRQAL